MQPSPETAEDLRGRFNYHPPPNEAVVEAHERLRSACYGAAMTVVERTPTCREQSLALTKLEEAMFWANAAVARHHDHYEAEALAETEPPEGLDEGSQSS